MTDTTARGRIETFLDRVRRGKIELAPDARELIEQFAQGVGDWNAARGRALQAGLPGDPDLSLIRAVFYAARQAAAAKALPAVPPRAVPINRLGRVHSVIIRVPKSRAA